MDPLRDPRPASWSPGLPGSEIRKGDESVVSVDSGCQLRWALGDQRGWPYEALPAESGAFGRPGEDSSLRRGDVKPSRTSTAMVTSGLEGWTLRSRVTVQVGLYAPESRYRLDSTLQSHSTGWTLRYRVTVQVGLYGTESQYRLDSTLQSHSTGWTLRSRVTVQVGLYGAESQYRLDSTVQSHSTGWTLRSRLRVTVQVGLYGAESQYRLDSTLQSHSTGWTLRFRVTVQVGLYGAESQYRLDSTVQTQSHSTGWTLRPRVTVQVGLYAPESQYRLDSTVQTQSHSTGWTLRSRLTVQVGLYAPESQYRLDSTLQSQVEVVQVGISGQTSRGSLELQWGELDDFRFKTPSQSPMFNREMILAVCLHSRIPWPIGPGSERYDTSENSQPQHVFPQKNGEITDGKNICK
ncbi:unnamed protein product [Boreogadus saida]